MSLYPTDKEEGHSTHSECLSSDCSFTVRLYHSQYSQSTICLSFQILDFQIRDVHLMSKLQRSKPGEVAHSFSPSIQGRDMWIYCEFEASLIYKESSRTVRASQRNPITNKQTNKKTTKITSKTKTEK